MKKLYKYQAIGALVLFVLIATLVSAGYTPNATEAAGTNSYYVAEWVWDDSDKDFPYWRTPYPDITAGLIDMRTLPQMAEVGPGSQCCMLLALTEPRISASLIPLGSELDKTVTPVTKIALEARLGVDDSLPTKNLRDTIYELLMFRADPTGQTAWKPLMPGSDRRIKVYLGSNEPLTIRQTGPLSPEWPVIREVLRTDFVGIKANSLARGDVTYQKVLGAWVEKYGVSADNIIPGETALKPSTSIVDDFNRASLGANWTAVDGTWSINASTELHSEGGATAPQATVRYDGTALSTSDHYAQITYTWQESNFSWMAPAVRFQAAANTFYGGFIRQQGTARAIFKVITGVQTSLNSDASGNGPSVIVRLDVSGSDLELFDDGVSALTVISDSSIPTGLYVGAWANKFDTAESRGDDFEAADLAAAVRRIFIIADGRRRKRRTLIEDVEEFLKKEREKVGQGSET